MNKHQALKEIENLKYKLSELEKKYNNLTDEYTLLSKWYKSKKKDYKILSKEAIRISVRFHELLDFITEIEIMTTSEFFTKFQPNDDIFTEEPRFDTCEFYRFKAIKFEEVVKKVKSILNGN